MMDLLDTDSLEMECDEEPDDEEVFQAFLSKGNNEVEITDQGEMFIFKEDAGLSDVPVGDMTVDLEEFHEEDTNEQDKDISDVHVEDEDFSDKDDDADEDWVGSDGDLESPSESCSEEASDEEVQKNYRVFLQRRELSKKKNKTAAPPNKRRKFLTLEQKIEVLKLSRNGMSARKIATAMDVGKTQILSIIQNRQAIEDIWESGANGNRKILSGRRCLYPGLNENVYDWFMIARLKKIPITGKLIQEKAVILSLEMGYDDFTASNEWLHKFQERYGSKCSVLSEESADVPADVVNGRKKRPGSITEGFEHKDIFNSDETGELELLAENQKSKKQMCVNEKAGESTEGDNGRISFVTVGKYNNIQYRHKVVGSKFKALEKEMNLLAKNSKTGNVPELAVDDSPGQIAFYKVWPKPAPRLCPVQVISDGPKDNCSQPLADIRAKRRNESTKPGTHVINSAKSRPSILRKSSVVTRRVQSGGSVAETKSGECNSYGLACEALNIGYQSPQDSRIVKLDKYNTSSTTGISIKEEPKSDSEDFDVGLPSRNAEQETRYSYTTFSTTEISIKEEPKSDVDDLDMDLPNKNVEQGSHTTANTIKIAIQEEPKTKFEDLDIGDDKEKTDFEPYVMVIKQESSSDTPQQCGIVISEENQSDFEPSNFLCPNTDHSYSFSPESCKEGHVHDEVCESSAQTFNTKLCSGNGNIDLNFSLSSKSSNDLQASSFKSSASMTRSMPVDVERTSNQSKTKFHLSKSSLPPTVSSVSRNISTNPQSNVKKMVSLLPTLEHPKSSLLFCVRTNDAQTQCLLTPDQSILKQKKVQSTTKDAHTQCAIMTTSLMQSNVNQEKKDLARTDTQIQCSLIPSFLTVKRKRKRKATNKRTKDAKTQCAMMVPHRHSVIEGFKSTTKDAQTQCAMAYYSPPSNQDHKSLTKDVQTQCAMTLPPTHTIVNCKEPRLTTKDAQVQCVKTRRSVYMYSTDDYDEDNYETTDTGIQCSMTPIPQHVIVESARSLSKQTKSQPLISRIELKSARKHSTTKHFQRDSPLKRTMLEVNNVRDECSATTPMVKSKQVLVRKRPLDSERDFNESIRNQKTSSRSSTQSNSTPVESNSYKTIDLCEPPSAEPTDTDSYMYLKWPKVNNVGPKSSATKPLTKSEQLLKRKSQPGKNRDNNLIPHKTINNVIELMLSHHRKGTPAPLPKPTPSQTSKKIFPLRFAESYRKKGDHKIEFERRWLKMQGTSASNSKS